MKRLKFLLVFVLMLVGTFTVLAFTSDKFHRGTLIRECLMYEGTHHPAILAAEIVNSDNWTPMPQFPNLYCPGGFYLCAICFDNSQVTQFEAMDILRYYYQTNGSLPAHGQTIYGPGGKLVTVYLKIDTE